MAKSLFKRVFPPLERTLGSSGWGRPGLRSPAHLSWYGAAMSCPLLLDQEKGQGFQSSNTKLFESHGVSGWGGRPCKKEEVHMKCSAWKRLAPSVPCNLPGNKRPRQPYCQQAPIREGRTTVRSIMWPEEACWNLVHVLSSCGLRWNFDQDMIQATILTSLSAGAKQKLLESLVARLPFFPSVFALGGEASKRIASC